MASYLELAAEVVLKPIFFARRWEHKYPKALARLLADEEQLLSFFQCNDPSIWPQIRTTNTIERRFRKVRRGTRPIAVFSDRTSMERIPYAVFSYENLRKGVATPFVAVTQNSWRYLYMTNP